MKELGKYEFNFPETLQEAQAWEPIIRVRALASRVLVVATTRVEGTWKAYADAVPGRDHSKEHQAVLASGDQVREEVARVLFKEFEGIPYAS